MHTQSTNLIRYETAETPDHAILVMEYAEGDTRYTCDCFTKITLSFLSQEEACLTTFVIVGDRRNDDCLRK
jgi:hypothetical protein